MSTPPHAALTDYLAAERTFLAWIRTGLALMGFGFVVARFGLFLQQLRYLDHVPTPTSYGLSLWFGTALIAFGVLINLTSAVRHVRMVRELDHGRAARGSLSQIVATAVFLALVGLAMAIYLLSVRGSAVLHSSLGESVMSPSAPGIVDLPCNHSVDEAVAKLKSILQAKGVMLFAMVDHSGEAEKVGMKMPPTKLLIFGSPKAGTPLMLASPSVAIDLPLKILVWQDPQGKTWVSYNSPDYLKDRHNLPQELLPNIAVIAALAKNAAE